MGCTRRGKSVIPKMGGGRKGGGCASGVGEETTVAAIVAWRRMREARGDRCQ